MLYNCYCYYYENIKCLMKSMSNIILLSLEMEIILKY